LLKDCGENESANLRKWALNDNDALCPEQGKEAVYRLLRLGEQMISRTQCFSWQEEKRFF
jgi:hypothetical protein